jgi:hypothetical protein
MKKSFFVCLGLLLFSFCQPRCQDTPPLDTAGVRSDSLLQLTAVPAAGLDSQAVDSALAASTGRWHRFFRADFPNPNKALYLSLAFPGGGQLYNRRWWKAPIVWGGYVALAYAADYNARNYRLLRDAYIAELSGEEHPFTGTRYEANDLKRLRDQFDKNRQLSYIGFLLLHLVQSAEAFVDSHLMTFDVSDDLSMRVGFSLQTTDGNVPAPGLGITWQIR